MHGEDGVGGGWRRGCLILEESRTAMGVEWVPVVVSMAK